jgi:hypothetical protein
MSGISFLSAVVREIFDQGVTGVSEFEATKYRCHQEIFHI